MSTAYDVWFVCERKKMYRSRKVAKLAANRLRRHTRRYDPRPLEVYLCPFNPEHWHIGHARKGERS